MPPRKKEQQSATLASVYHFLIKLQADLAVIVEHSCFPDPSILLSQVTGQVNALEDSLAKMEDNNEETNNCARCLANADDPPGMRDRGQPDT